MKINCDVARDLLPLYADEACSETSRQLVEEHLEACGACRDLLKRLRRTELESDLRSEKNSVLQYGRNRFKRRSAAVGSAVSGLFMIPILICLIVNIVSELTMNWFVVTLAALSVAASLIIVPLMAPRDKLFWTFCAFCVSLMLLLGSICLYTHGSWFWIASSSTLFGLSVVFLPFAVKARPMQRLIGNANRPLFVLGVDAALFVNMMYMISHQKKAPGLSWLFIIALVAGIGLIVLELLRKRQK